MFQETTVEVKKRTVLQALHQHLPRNPQSERELDQLTTTLTGDNGAPGHHQAPEFVRYVLDHQFPDLAQLDMPEFEHTNQRNDVDQLRDAWVAKHAEGENVRVRPEPTMWAVAKRKNGDVPF